MRWIRGGCVRDTEWVNLLKQCRVGAVNFNCNMRGIRAVTNDILILGFVSRWRHAWHTIIL